MITADEMKELKERSGTKQLCTDYTLDTLRKIKEAVNADRVRIEIGGRDDGFDAELCVFKGDRVYPFLVDRSDLDASMYLVDFVKESIESMMP
ncbi:unnamed protein product [marine sediment metagenome]|uniref:Uncharacterized protein n=1 Tax=marine sediment metagenome TaxID=412755 RepID=X0ZJN2_9ZZZZ